MAHIFRCLTWQQMISKQENHSVYRGIDKTPRTRSDTLTIITPSPDPIKTFNTYMLRLT